MVRKARSTTDDHHNTQHASPRASHHEGSGTHGRSATSVVSRPAEDLVAHAREYARERPEVVALWCLGMGFVLGWKLKPW
ncbi:MAG TPA: hypothetical protein VGG64_19580 [Pirellulales bacterium]